MKAIRYTEYGPLDVLQLTEVATPVPKDDEILIRIRAASVNPIDWRLMRGTPYPIRMMTGLRRPKETRVGHDLAGQVEAVGGKVTQFRPGDAVFGASDGAFAEYVCTSESDVVPMPANVTFEQAAAVAVAGLTALQGLRDRGRVQPGQKVLINGAAGGVGTFAVQIARSFGADVTGVCSTRNVDLVQSLGADHVVDYTREDFTRTGQRHDLILDMIGNRSLSDCRRALTPKGTLVWVGGPLRGMPKAVVVSPFVSQNLVVLVAKIRKEDLITLRELLGAGTVTPVIDRSYPLEKVPEAIRYLEEGHARGKVVITMDGSADA
ncbi:MAG TPA: NAD(P)-dependent alcohol dehydrogenase [Gemmatimonadota bacterium]|nr:NAD(P)-dependent alcohol dehydrogenase [Gemmatimonadota bacterium]